MKQTLKRTLAALTALTLTASFTGMTDALPQLLRVDNMMEASASNGFSLGTPEYIEKSGGYDICYSNATAPNISGVTSITVNIDKKATITGESCASTNANYSARTSTTYIYNVSSLNATGIQAFIKNLRIEYVSGMTVTITLDTATSSLPAGASIAQGANGYTDHYYMFVSGGMTWLNAYNSAKSFSYKGMQGYLVTVTSAEENKILDNITSKSGWSGGVRVRYGSNRDKIANYGGISGDLYYSDISNASYMSWYWACGPESTDEFFYGADYNDASVGPLNSQYTYWGEQEPNGGDSVANNTEGCMLVHYPTAGKWNDYANTKTDLDGYFVEFGGYTAGSDPGGYNPNSPSSTATASNSVPAPTINSVSISNLSLSANSDNKIRINTATVDSNIKITDIVIQTTKPTNIYNKVSAYALTGSDSSYRQEFSNLSLTSADVAAYIKNLSFDFVEDMGISITVKNGTNHAKTSETLNTSALAKWSAQSVRATSFSGGDGSKWNPFQITSANQLGYLAYMMQMYPSYRNMNFILMNDIDLDAHEWVAPLTFNGEFDGNGNTISNLKGCTGLFETITGEVRNLNLTNAAVSLKDNFKTSVGILADTADGAVIDNVHVGGTLTWTSTKNAGVYAGGIVGTIKGDDSVIRNSISAATVTLTNTSNGTNISSVGGMAGNASAGKIYNAGVTSTLTETVASSGNAKIGGIAGTSADSVWLYNCYFNGAAPTITAGTTKAIGGITAEAEPDENSNVTSCYSNVVSEDATPTAGKQHGTSIDSLNTEPSTTLLAQLQANQEELGWSNIDYPGTLEWQSDTAFAWGGKKYKMAYDLTHLSALVNTGDAATPYAYSDLVRSDSVIKFEAVPGYAVPANVTLNTNTEPPLSAANTIQLGTIDADQTVVGVAAALPSATITLNAGGGTLLGMTPVNGCYNKTIESEYILPVPLAPLGSETLAFGGWYTEPDFRNRVTTAYTSNDNTTYYAKWVYSALSYQDTRMFYRYNNNSADVRGVNSNSLIQTTYGNGGYRAFYQFGSVPGGNNNRDYSGLQFSFPTSLNSDIFQNIGNNIYVAQVMSIQGGYTTINYLIQNRGTAAYNGSLNIGAAADVQIRYNDSAEITKQIENGNTYLNMAESSDSSAQQFRLYVTGTGVTNANRYWVGGYSGYNNLNGEYYTDNVFNDTQNNGNAKDRGFSGGDSALAFSWNIASIGAGQTVTKTVRLGVGTQDQVNLTNVLLSANGGTFSENEQQFLLDGASHSNITVKSDGSINTSSQDVAAPTRDGYTFVKWLDANGNPINNVDSEGRPVDTVISSDTTIYAQWEQNQTATQYSLKNNCTVGGSTSGTPKIGLSDDTTLDANVEVAQDATVANKVSVLKDYHAEFIIPTGYLMPASITVTVGGKALTEGSGYTYLRWNGNRNASITIHKEYLTGDVVIAAVGHPAPAGRPDTLAVEPPVTITCSQSGSMTAVVAPSTLNNHTYTYQWYQANSLTNQLGTSISGATSATYSPSGLAAGEYFYYCVITATRTDNNQSASLTSNAVGLTVNKNVRTWTGSAPYTSPQAFKKLSATPTIPNANDYAYYAVFDNKGNRVTNSIKKTDDSATQLEQLNKLVPDTYTIKTYYEATDTYEAGEIESPKFTIQKGQLDSVTPPKDKTLTSTYADADAVIAGGELPATAVATYSNQTEDSNATVNLIWEFVPASAEAKYNASFSATNTFQWSIDPTDPLYQTAVTNGKASGTVIITNKARQILLYVVGYDANGGTCSRLYDYPTSIQHVYLTSLPTPTREGYNFLGWFTAAEGGVQVTTQTEIIENITVYAHWEEAEVCLLNPVVQNGNTVTYDAVDGAVSYRIYLNGALATIAENTTYCFQTMIPGQTYEIGVAAVYIDSSISRIETTTMTAVEILPRPQNISRDYETLSWDAVDGAESYQVWLIDADTNQILSTYNTTDTEFAFDEMEEGHNYQLRVCPVDANGCYGQAFTTEPAFPYDARPQIPATPANLQVLYGNAIQFDAVEGAAKYNIYLNGRQATEACNTLYCFQNMVAGRSYDIGVAAVFPDGTEGAQATTTMTAVQILDRPEGLMRDYEILSWEEVIDAQSYQLWLIDADTNKFLCCHNTTDTQFAFDDMVVGKNYQLRVCAVDANGRYGRSHTTEPSFTYVARPANTNAPKNLRQIYGNAISYNPVDGAVKYNIYLNGNLATVAANTLYCFQNMMADSTYDIGVAAVFADGSEGDMATTTMTAVQILDRPENLVRDYNNLSWDAVEGAQAYKVWVIDADTNKFVSSYGAITTNHYAFSTLEVGKNYQLRVCAIDENGRYGRSLTTVPAFTYEERPSVNDITNLRQIYGNAVTWTTAQNAVKYNIYLNGNLATVAANNIYAFQNMTAGSTYTVSVAAVLADGTETTKQTISMNAVSILARPENLVVTGSTLTWDAVANANGYKVWIIDPATNLFINANSNVSTNSYTFASMTEGAEYQLRVCAIDENGYYGRSLTTDVFTYSKALGSVKQVSGNAVKWTGTEADYYEIYQNGKLATKTVNASYAFQNMTAGTAYTITVKAITGNSSLTIGSTTVNAVSLLAKPTGLKRSGNVLSWNAVAGAAKYKVYVIDATTNKIITFNTRVTATSYNFRTLVAGKQYKLRVCAVDANGALGKSVTSGTFTAQ